MSYTSRLPAIATEIAARMDAATGAAAEKIAHDAKTRVPVNTGALRDAIHVERTAIGQHTVIAGNTTVFYGHIVEHGGAHTPPRPFLVPAAEDAGAHLEKIGQQALKDL